MVLDLLEHLSRKIWNKILKIKIYLYIYLYIQYIYIYIYILIYLSIYLYIPIYIWRSSNLRTLYCCNRSWIPSMLNCLRSICSSLSGVLIFVLLHLYLEQNYFCNAITSISHLIWAAFSSLNTESSLSNAVSPCFCSFLTAQFWKIC